MTYAIMQHTSYIILHCEIDFNNFEKDYVEKYLNAITYAFVCEKLALKGSTKVKKNGYWTRTFIYILNGKIVKIKVKIQKMVWYDEDGTEHYVSVFPSFIIRYCKISTDLIDALSKCVGKDEDILNHIDDPDNAIDCEDPIAKALENMEKRCISNNYDIELSSRYVFLDNSFSRTAIDFIPRYPRLYSLYITAKSFLQSEIGIFTELNLTLHF